ncbi:RICIN domain-containing protein [Nostoc sp.]|uniref:RICIN domain-containing protein n=1 Tax=Nostoc sp. TaxID=1180 RepID=UPI002FFC53EF
MKKVQIVASLLLLLTATIPSTQFAEPAKADALLSVPVKFQNTQQYYYLVSRDSNKCAQVNQASKANGTPITLWNCVNQNNVKWKFVSAGGYSYYLVAKHSNKCLHVQGAGLGNNAQITQWDCVNQNNVKWELFSAGNNYYYFRAVHSLKCLHVNRNAKNNGARISQWTCLNQPNVQWYLTTAP